MADEIALTETQATEEDISTPATEEDGTVETDVDDTDAQLAQFLRDEDDEDEPEADEEITEEHKETKKEARPKGPTVAAKPKEEAEAPRTFKVKVDGQELEITEDELKRGYSTHRASMKRFEEAAGLRRQSEALVRMLKEDPIAVLSHPSLGLNVRKLMEDHLVELLRYDELPVEQRALVDAQRRADQLRREAEGRERQLQEAQVEQAQAHWEERLGRDFADALGRSGLPKEPKIVARMAQLQLRAMDMGVDYSADDLVAMVKEELAEGQRSILGGMTPEELEAFVGKDRIRDLARRDLEQSKQRTRAARPAVKQAPRKAKGTKHWTSQKDLDDHLRSMGVKK